MHLREVRELQGTAHVPWRDRLYSLNIRHVEQLGSFLAAPAGRYALEQLFPNSWGEDWAFRNDFGQGYGCLPYEYLSRFCLEATAIDALVPPTKAAKKTAKAPAKRPAGQGNRAPVGDNSRSSQKKRT